VLFNEMIAVYSENYTKPVNAKWRVTVCWNRWEIIWLNIWLERVKFVCKCVVWTPVLNLDGTRCVVSWVTSSGGQTHDIASLGTLFTGGVRQSLRTFYCNTHSEVKFMSHCSASMQFWIRANFQPVLLYRFLGRPQKLFVQTSAACLRILFDGWPRNYAWSWAGRTRCTSRRPALSSK
jgi:hypothetical protein